MAWQGEKTPVNPKKEKEKKRSGKVQSEVVVHESLSSGIEGCEIDLNEGDTVAGYIGAADSSLFSSQKYNRFKDWQDKHFPLGARKFFGGETSQNQVDEQSNVLGVMTFDHPTSFGGNCSDKRIRPDASDYFGDLTVFPYQAGLAFLQNNSLFRNNLTPTPKDFARAGFCCEGNQITCTGCGTQHLLNHLVGRPSRSTVWHRDNCPFSNRRRPTQDDFARVGFHGEGNQSTCSRCSSQYLLDHFVDRHQQSPERNDLDVSGKVIEIDAKTGKNVTITDEGRQECPNFENGIGWIRPVNRGGGNSVTKILDNEKKVLSVPEISRNPEEIQKPKSVRKKNDRYPDCLKNEPVLSRNEQSTKNSLHFSDDYLESLGSKNILSAKQCDDGEIAHKEADALPPSFRKKYMDPKHEPPEIRPQQNRRKNNVVDGTSRHKELRNDKDEEEIPIQKETPDADVNIGNEALENGIDENGQMNFDFDKQQTKEPGNESFSSNCPNENDQIGNVIKDTIPEAIDILQDQTRETDHVDISSSGLNKNDHMGNVTKDIIPEEADITQPQTKETRNEEISPSKPEHIPELFATNDLIDDRAKDTVLGATDDPPESTDEFCEEKLIVNLPSVVDVVDGMGNTPDKFPDPIPDNEINIIFNNDELSLQERMVDQLQSLEIETPAPGKKSKENCDEEGEEIGACNATMGNSGDGYGGENQDSCDDDYTDTEDVDGITSLKRLFKKSKDFSSDDETVETEAEFIKQKADGKLFTPPTSDVVVPNYQGIYDSRTTYNQSLESFLHNRNVRENPRIPIDDLARNRYILTGDNATCMGCNTRHSIRDIEGRPSRNIVWHQDNCPFANRRRPCADCSSTFVEDDGLEYCTQCRQPIRRIRATSDLLAHLPQNLEPPDPSGRTVNSCVICHRDIQYRHNQDVCVVCGGRICRRCVRREERHFH
uniref:uncharacterized protein LOC120334200 n=1 Tax=Styela clava TaxID=7725 RepID=UPI00193A304F|nr:uncharacterized protein LOC120334200 [Styela clava]